jgi:hypothetical protein
MSSAHQRKPFLASSFVLDSLKERHAVVSDAFQFGSGADSAWSGPECSVEVLSAPLIPLQAGSAGLVEAVDVSRGGDPEGDGSDSEPEEPEEEEKEEGGEKSQRSGVLRRDACSEVGVSVATLRALKLVNLSLVELLNAKTKSTAVARLVAIAAPRRENAHVSLSASADKQAHVVYIPPTLAHTLELHRCVRDCTQWGGEAQMHAQTYIRVRGYGREAASDGYARAHVCVCVFVCVCVPMYTCVCVCVLPIIARATLHCATQHARRVPEHTHSTECDAVAGGVCGVPRRRHPQCC